MFERRRKKKRIDWEIVSIAEPVNIVTCTRPPPTATYRSERSFSRAALRVNPSQ
jgi:hypothetical protein